MLAAHPYVPVLIQFVAVAAFVVAVLLLSHFLGPRRHGRVKDSTYESGMPTIRDARGRFNARFYLVALVFLLFDVEVVFLWPWAALLFEAARARDGVLAGTGVYKGFLLGEMAVFVAILLIGYLYAWRRGVFRWT